MEETFPRSLDSLDRIFDFVTGALNERNADDATLFSIKLATEELFTNMVKYNSGAGNEISIGIDVAGGTITVNLIDNDVDPFDPETADEAGIGGDVEDRRIGGLGLRLVRSVVDKITYEYEGRRMTVRLTRQLGRR
jgi:anti-sigma regulatory factor (Ser/Thr protein kinase)